MTHFGSVSKVFIIRKKRILMLFFAIQQKLCGDGKRGNMFWQALEQLHRWERENLPGADTSVGNEVLVWLLKSRNKPRPLKHLYRSSRFSEPTIRSCLKEYAAQGFAVIESNGEDMRTRFACATPKLEFVVAEYRKRFQEVAAFAHLESTSTKATSLCTASQTVVPCA